MFKNLIARLQQRLADDRRYRRAIAEIEAMSARELSDLRADPAEMRRHVWQSIYGQRGA